MSAGNLSVLFLLVVAGGAILGQNALMAKISSEVPTILIPLVLNSAVGITLLSILLIVQSGTDGIVEAAKVFRPVNLLPGVLGSFFVFASIVGYQRLGAAPTIAVLVTSQLAFGVISDVFKAGSTSSATIVGVLLLAAGAALVVSRLA